MQSEETDGKQREGEEYQKEAMGESEAGSWKTTGACEEQERIDKKDAEALGSAE